MAVFRSTGLLELLAFAVSDGASALTSNRLTWHVPYRGPPYDIGLRNYTPSLRKSRAKPAGPRLQRLTLGSSSVDLIDVTVNRPM